MAAPTLPSVVAAEALWTRKPEAPKLIAVSLLERAAIVAPALWLAGERQPKGLFVKTAAVVLAIEAVVLWQVKRQLGATS